MCFITVKFRVCKCTLSRLLNVNVFQPACYLFWKLKKMDSRAGCCYSRKLKKKKREKKESIKLHTKDTENVE